jgi:hypothetical protein
MTRCFGRSLTSCSPGTNVIISRTDPKLDAVRIENSKDQMDEPLIGSVYSFTKGILRVVWPDEVEDLDKGDWRYVLLLEALGLVRSSPDLYMLVWLAYPD